MNFVPMSELLERGRAGGYAVPSFCAWNAETMETVLRVASDLEAPVIMMSGPGEFGVLGPAAMGAAAKAVAQRFDVPAALHLDHGDSLDQVRDCIDAGYTSVMLDFSTRPYDENAAALREAVRMARPHGVTVEGEIGAVGRCDDTSVEGGKTSTLTEPDDAVRYVADTGIDCLAVAIGNAHGIYTVLPRFDFARLEAIRAAVRVPLVLHGGSGTPEPDLKRAIALGMAKVNVASEICRAFRTRLDDLWRGGDKRWLPIGLGDATRAIAPVIERWLRLTGAAGKAK